MISHDRVRQYLEGLEFPTTKERLIGFAMGKNAPGDVIDTLNRLPSQQYHSLDSVWGSLDIDSDVDSDLDVDVR